MNMQKMLPVIVVLVLAGIGGTGFFYTQYQKTQKELATVKTDPNTLRQAVAADVRKLVEEVGKVIALPEGEEPTVATITDIEKLKDQEFFANARNGDKVLIYTNARRAILYDPVAKKVLNVAPVNIGTGSAAPAQTEPKIKVALYNGTTTAGLTSTVERQVEGKITTIEVSSKENASKEDYTKTIVVDLSGSRRDLARELASVVGGEVGTLPEGESKPETDLLVIIGSEYKP